MFLLKTVDLVQQVTFMTQDLVAGVSTSFFLEHGNCGIQDLYGLGPSLPKPVQAMLKLSDLINSLPCEV